MTRRIILSCVMGLALLCAAPTADAQAAAKAGKAISKLIRKAKPPKSKPVKFREPSKTTKPKTRTGRYRGQTTVQCSVCHGSGKVLYWNSYYGNYQYTTCSNCNGVGRVSRYSNY